MRWIGGEYALGIYFLKSDIPMMKEERSI